MVVAALAHFLNANYTVIDWRYDEEERHHPKLRVIKQTVT